ncbi:MAG: hypothetical protein E6G15_08110 [Actinobacteria bacterium]|nr:MAG: hypothetical protein E6G15_08110 [Actinomycetota bacterium]
MLPGWHQNLESFEAISQDDLTRGVVLRMSFLVELADDGELDDATKVSLQEIASDPAFLLAVEDYVHRTEILH